MYRRNLQDSCCDKDLIKDLSRVSVCGNPKSLFDLGNIPGYPEARVNKNPSLSYKSQCIADQINLGLNLHTRWKRAMQILTILISYKYLAYIELASFHFTGGN